MCVLGGRLLTTQSYTVNGTKFCTKDIQCIIANQTVPCPLYKLYCSDVESNHTCDLFWSRSPIEIRKAFHGFPYAFKQNLFSGYLRVGDSNPGEKGDLSKGQVIEQDTSTSFLILIGILSLGRAQRGRYRYFQMKRLMTPFEN